MNKRADLYDADELYSFIEGVATEHNMKQTLIALPLMKELHKGQFRSGKDKKPYIVHPMMVAKHACVLNLLDDELIAAILLHDVIEDCQITIKELPVNANEKEKQVAELTQKVNDLEAKIDQKDTEIFNLKRQILTLEINQKVSEATATPPKTKTPNKK